MQKDNRTLTRQIKYLLLGLTLFFCQHSFGQKSKIDSLTDALLITKNDTSKASTLLLISEELLHQQPDTVIILSNQILELSEKNNYTFGIKNANNNLGVINMNKGNNDVALKYFFKVLKISEEAKDSVYIAKSYNNIGIIYRNQDDFKKSMEYTKKSLAIRKNLKDKKGQAVCLTNIGLNYWSLYDYENSLKYSFEAEKLFKETGFTKFLGNVYNNIADVYDEQGKYQDAIKYLKKSFEIKVAQNDKYTIPSFWNNVGSLYIKLKMYDSAFSCLSNGLKLAKDYGSMQDINKSYEHLSFLFAQKKEFEKAYNYYQLYSQTKDTLFNENKTKQITEMETKYQTEKKDNEIKLLNTEKEKERAIAEEKSRKQKIIIWSVISGFLLVTVFAFFIFRSLRITSKQKQIIEVQKIEVEKQKHTIEEKNKDITDSINYAKRIQQAKLPDKKEIHSALPNSFVLFKPKDIVSGDFYYFYKDDKSVFIASADCTGHGVPGAFMSMIGSEKLDDALAHSVDTSEILSHLNKGIKSSLRQTDSNESTRDGMDIALCSVDTDARVIKYAGANRPLWIIRNGQTVVEEIKATKKAIGGFTEDSQHFDTHEIKLQQGDTFYISTDGYADTFGKQDKKLTTKKFKEILLSIQDKSLKEQEQHLDNFIEDWKGETEQVDDILVIGVRL
ncbi:MAG: tetratricopeptide repeat protein [Bacteroidetes bacterium]|nr:tetratricopeptide repeat protein [Bacteroidota bacterium]